MERLEDVTPHFGVDRVWDAAAAEGWIAAAAGAAGLVCLCPKDGQVLRFTAATPLQGPFLLWKERVFFQRFRGTPDPGDGTLRLEPFLAEDGPTLDAASPPHHAFAGRTLLHLRTEEGDLVCIHPEEGRSGIPATPYGRYAKTELCVFGLAPGRRSAVVQARHPGRKETLVDVLPEDRGRPVARAAMLKDEEWGAPLFGPAVAARRAALLAPKRGCLLLLHLHNPEVRETVPAPEVLCAEPEVLLAADSEGTVAAASRLGIHLLHGPGAPGFAPFPSGGPWTPLRLLWAEGFVLVVTREGRLFGARGP